MPNSEFIVGLQRPSTVKVGLLNGNKRREQKTSSLPTNNWLRLKCTGVVSNPEGIIGREKLIPLFLKSYAM